MSFFNYMNIIDKRNDGNEGRLDIGGKMFRIISSDRELTDDFIENNIDKIHVMYYKSSGFQGRCNEISIGKFKIQNGMRQVVNAITNRVNTTHGIFLILIEE